MAQALPSLPDRITTWIRQQGGNHALLLITVDGQVRPHIMMLARDEICVVSSTRLRVAVREGTQTAENLRLRTSATLAIYDQELACVIKTRTESVARLLLPGTLAQELLVEDVRFDVPSTEEASARLVTGLRFEGRAERIDLKDRLKKF